MIGLATYHVDGKPLSSLKSITISQGDRYSGEIELDIVNPPVDTSPIDWGKLQADPRSFTLTSRMQRGRKVVSYLNCRATRVESVNSSLEGHTTAVTLRYLDTFETLTKRETLKVERAAATLFAMSKSNCFTLSEMRDPIVRAVGMYLLDGVPMWGTLANEAAALFFEMHKRHRFGRRR